MQTSRPVARLDEATDLTAAFVRLALPQPTAGATVFGVAEAARPVFEGMPGLLAKVFTFDEKTGEAVNVYLWESGIAARSFFTEAWLERISRAYGAPPRVSFAKVAGLVDNIGR